MRLFKLALVIGAVALMCSPALAQRQPGRGGRGFGGGGQVGAAQLVRIEKVQKDLGLDADAVKKVEDALTKVREDHRDDFQKIGFQSTASDEEKAKARQAINEATDKALAGNLSEKQVKRLHQIQHQVQGFAMFEDEKIQKELKLTDKQKDEIKDINKDLQKDLEGLRPAAGEKPNFQEMFTKMAAVRKDAQTKAMKILTDDQKKQVKELTGKPLELTPQDLQGGRGGRGRGNPGKPDKPPRTDFDF